MGYCIYIPSLSLFFCFILFFCFAPKANESSQAMGQIRATTAHLTPQPQQHRIQTMSVTYATAHGNNGSLTHWARPGIEPASSCIPVGFVTTEPQQELLMYIYILYCHVYNIPLNNRITQVLLKCTWNIHRIDYVLNHTEVSRNFKRIEII